MLNISSLSLQVVELPMLHPKKFVRLGIDPPRGVLFYSPPGTGKTLIAKAVANRTDACFIRVVGTELIRRYIGQGPKIVRQIFRVVFFSENATILYFLSALSLLCFVA